jgi:hypothetical protein
VYLRPKLEPLGKKRRRLPAKRPESRLIDKRPCLLNQKANEKIDFCQAVLKKN